MSSFLKKYKNDLRIQFNKYWLILEKKEFTEQQLVGEILDYYIPRFQKDGIVTSTIEKVEKDSEYLPVKLSDIPSLARMEANEEAFKKFYEYDLVPVGDIIIFYYPDKEINLIVDGVHRLCNRVINNSLAEEITCHYIQSKYLPKASMDIRMIIERR